MQNFRKNNRRIKKPISSDAKSGFTMVELSLAMAFIAVLLIIIAIVATSLVSVYQKGLSIKAVNGVGRNLIDEFTRAINTAPSVDTTSLCNSLATNNVAGCVSDHANNYIYLEQRSGTNAVGRSEQYNGVFCTGYYSYIWNTRAGFDSNHTVNLVYLDDHGNVQTLHQPRLARITDKTYRLCSANVDTHYHSTYPTATSPANPNGIDINITQQAHNGSDILENRIDTPVTDFLRMFDTDLALYDLTIFPISQDSVTLRSFFSGTFVLATLRGSVDILADGDYCDPNGFRTVNPIDGTVETSSSQNSLGSEFNYCAINKFNFAARTAGSGV